MQPAKQSRVNSFVRLGAGGFVDFVSWYSPSIWWQPEQPFCWNSAYPSAASPEVGLVSGASIVDTHFAHPAWSCTTTFRRMLACEVPQNSAHWPEYTPGWSASSSHVCLRPGTTSCLPLRRGAQNEWMTSLDSSVR